VVVLWSAALLFGGGSGLNVAVVVNTNSANSLQLGNYFCEKRQVPAQNVLRMGWIGANTQWGLNEFRARVFDPLLAMLASRELTNQIEYVVISMDIPYRVSSGVEYVNSTTSSLFYGFKPDTNSPFVCPIATNSANAYAGSEGIFRETPPIATDSNSFLVTMITSSNLALAKQIVDSGVQADGAFPTQTVYLFKTTDNGRNIRYALFDNAIFNTRVGGHLTMVRTNSDTTTNLGGITGFEFGRTTYSLQDTTFAPGAMADNLTSFGGFIFENSFGQTILLDILRAGAAGSYGTIVEPCAYLAKFPTPQNYFYQSRGFSLAECYYQSVTNPYQGLIVGEPLSAPFALPADGDWDDLSTNALLIGTTNLSLHFAASDVRHPIQQVDLFVDGVFHQTVTNVLPAAGNILYVTINGVRTNYTVAGSATIQSVASNLASRLDGSAYKSAAKIAPYAHGDRIELQSTNVITPGSLVSVSTSNDVGSATALTAQVHAARTDCLDSAAWGIQRFIVGTGVVPNDVLTLVVSKTNGVNVIISVTNTTGLTNLSQFVQRLMNTNNATTSLQGSDGLIAEDLVVLNANYVRFTLRARGEGIRAAQIGVVLAGDFEVFPPPPLIYKLDENLGDLHPRNHLYVTAGLTNLSVVFPFETTTTADGWHELTAVAYEGSHVRTQRRVSRPVFVQNTPLSAVFNCLACDMNVGLEGMLNFSVVANTNTVTRIELFSTGGSWGVITNESSAFFSVAATNLQLGLHPFYAVVTRDDGKQYRTETRWIRIAPSFELNIDGNGPTLSWLAQTGGFYEVLSATSATGTFQVRDALTATNSPTQWPETNNSAPQQFYRVRMQP
jgi:uncharacterized protein (TIGR03790 family)